MIKKIKRIIPSLFALYLGATTGCATMGDVKFELDEREKIRKTARAEALEQERKQLIAAKQAYEQAKTELDDVRAGLLTGVVQQLEEDYATRDRSLRTRDKNMTQFLREHIEDVMLPAHAKKEKEAREKGDKDITDRLNKVATEAGKDVSIEGFYARFVELNRVYDGLFEEDGLLTQMQATDRSHDDSLRTQGERIAFFEQDLSQLGAGQLPRQVKPALLQIPKNARLYIVLQRIYERESTHQFTYVRQPVAYIELHLQGDEEKSLLRLLDQDEVKVAVHRKNLEVYTKVRKVRKQEQLHALRGRLGNLDSDNLYHLASQGFLKKPLTGEPFTSTDLAKKTVGTSACIPYLCFGPVDWNSK